MAESNLPTTAESNFPTTGEELEVKNEFPATGEEKQEGKTKSW